MILLAIVRRFASLANATKRTYTKEWGAFVDWCRARTPEVSPLPAAPQTVARYITHLADAGRKAAGIELVLAAIGAAHRAAGLRSPRGDGRVHAVRQGIRRSIGTKQAQKTPAIVEDLRAVLDALPDDNPRLALRDQALLLIGFIGLSALRARRPRRRAPHKDQRWTDRRARPHQDGPEAKGRVVAIPPARHPALCPIAALEAWLSAAGIREGAVFRGVDRHGNVRPSRLSTQAVANVIKRSVERVGLDPRQFSGHSLRSGFITAAALAGKSEDIIRSHTGHKSVLQVREYVRLADPWRDNAADGLL
ncbi:MAG: site-specific integrase [Parvibaculum sp.]